MEGRTPSVRVSGFPTDESTDDIQLYFESLRFCPLGGGTGSVDNVQLEADGSAIVTFSDENGKNAFCMKRIVLGQLC